MRGLLHLFLILFPFLVTSQKSQLIQHVTIVDGTGRKEFKGSVRIAGNQIVGIGKLKPFKNEKVIQGNGLTLAPGFIDSHSHHLNDVLEHPDAISTANQGVTTVVVGQDGESVPLITLISQVNKTPVAVNIATYTGQSSLREQVMGSNNLLRAATQAEIDRMKVLLKKDMENG